MPLFVISFEYLAKPVSPKFAIILQLLFVQDARFCHHIEILPNLRRILPEICWFRKKWHFRKKPTFNDILPLSSCFNFCQECLFCGLIENFC